MLRARARISPFRTWRRTLGRSLRRTFLRPQMVAFLPALMLGGFWFGGQGVLMILALTFPLLLVLGGLFEREARPVDGLTGLLTLDAFSEEIDTALASPRTDAESLIVVAFELDGAEALAGSLGPAAMETVLCRTADRLTSATRGGDHVARLDTYRFGVLISPVRGAGMDLALRTVERLQGAVADPISVDARTIYVSVSAGFCLERRAPRATGEAMLEAASAALTEARAIGESAVRAYSAEMRARLDHRESVGAELSRALDDGEIVAWFQPQINARSGAVSGVEALARWVHPRQGLVPPGDFLPIAEANGLMERVGETMLFQGLSALRKWDRAGLSVPRIGINFSPAELRNPKLVERVRWELDRFDLAPERLAVEILETVVVDASDDTIAANIAGLAQLGCTIDLDDFGMGTASIANIRRFAVSRIKIDRSFVTRLDSDPSQYKMVDALLSMAAKLEIETLAEGVETPAEHRALAAIGCGHLQGFGIARPMAIDDMSAWLRQSDRRYAGPPLAGLTA